MDKLDQEFMISDFYAMGFSNGGGFIYQLYMADELARRFSGFAAAGAGVDKLKLEAAHHSVGIAGYAPNKKPCAPFCSRWGL